jgi:hypothetical protein
MQFINMEKDRLIIGLIEKIILENGKEYLAKIDTGADSSSIDKKILEKLGEKKIISHKTVRSALGRHRRPTILLEIVFQDKKFIEKFSISDRQNLKYKILIGNDILKKEKFLIDPCKEKKQ